MNMGKRLLACLTVLALLAAAGLVQAEGTENDAEDLFVLTDPAAMEDMDRFGWDARVERNGEGAVISVNGYPVRTVRAAMNIRNTEEAYEFDIDFVDYPFYQSAAQYDGNLAVMSLAMAMSANRALNMTEEPEEDFDPALHVEQFLLDAGFQDIRKDDYSKETSMYTVSTAMGHRLMTEDTEEPFTLIAIGVCGAYYKNEWQSNMTPGDGDVHEGFQAAAGLVMDRLAGYIMTEGIQGRIKIWISGFSRAAAVSNLTAGALVAEGAFPKEDVYAYTFATPAALRNPPESGFENIFNIISPMDLVPQVMPYAWGFGRYGVNLYLPVTEFSSFLGGYLTEERAAVAQRDFGIQTNYSPALNLRARLLLSMVLDLIGDQENYNQRFQPVLVGLMQNKNVSYALNGMRSLLEHMNGAGWESRVSLDRLVNYVLRVFGNILTRTSLDHANENSGGAGLRLLGEHREDVYLANMETLHHGLLETTETFTYVMIRGPVSVAMRIMQKPEDYMEELEGQILLTEEGGKTASGYFAISEGEDEAEEPPFYLERMGETSILAVPHDLDYLVTWEATAGGTVEILQAECSVHANASYPGAVSGAMRVKAGDTGVAFRHAEGKNELPEGFTEKTFDAAELADFLDIADFGISWRLGFMILNVLLGGLLALIPLLIMKRHRLGRKYGVAVWGSLAVFCIAMLETEEAFWFFADQIWIRAVWKAVIGVTLGILYAHLHAPKKPVMRTLLPGLTLAVIADLVISFFFLPGAGIFLLAHVAFIFSFLSRNRMKKGKWIQWAILSVVVSGLIIWRMVPTMGAPAWAAAIYAPVLFLMGYSAGGQAVRVRYAARMFVVSDLLLGTYFTVLPDPLVHVIYMLLFYLALLLMAICHEGKRAGTETAGK